MTPWQEFYRSVKDQTWPDCDSEQDFHLLPTWIQRECQDTHGYVPGQYRSQGNLTQRIFPIKTSTACQLKWNWSTIYLEQGRTASCHRTNHHEFDFESFDFHNTPEKIQDRQRMLQGLWPDKGCSYCENIEQAGGQSDRLTNLDFPGMHAPPELDRDHGAVRVTPRILEVYFDNTCNLKCVYCSSTFSSLWEAENRKHGRFEKNGVIIIDKVIKSHDKDANKERMFQWLIQHGHHLTQFNILGGEPLYQKELERCLDLFDQHPAPNLELHIFSNLMAPQQRVQDLISRVGKLRDQEKIRNFSVTASLDCWGAPQEYARYPLDLSLWENNFSLLLAQSWIRLVIGSTITPLTIHTLPDLMQRINDWKMQRPVYHYFNSVNWPSFMFIDIFGDLFQEDFDRCLSLIDQSDPEQRKTHDYLDGIARQSRSRGTDRSQIIQLHTFIEEMDRRRGTNWKKTFPWLVDDILQQVDKKPSFLV
jgi:hypothetical protein